MSALAEEAVAELSATSAEAELLSNPIVMALVAQGIQIFEAKLLAEIDAHKDVVLWKKNLLIKTFTFKLGQLHKPLQQILDKLAGTLGGTVDVHESEAQD